MWMSLVKHQVGASVGTRILQPHRFHRGPKFVVGGTRPRVPHTGADRERLSHKYWFTLRQFLHRSTASSGRSGCELAPLKKSKLHRQVTSRIRLRRTRDKTCRNIANLWDSLERSAARGHSAETNEASNVYHCQIGSHMPKDVQA